MKLNKKIISTLACASVISTAFVTVKAVTQPTEVKAASTMNNYILSQGFKYSGVNVLPSTFTEDFAYNNGHPEGIVIHETADPGATAANEASYFRNNWQNIYAYVHAFVDQYGVQQIHPTNRGVWGAGPVANGKFIQVELCEEPTKYSFAKSVNNDAIYVANLLKQYGLRPSLADGTGSGTIWSHNAVSKYLGGTDHTDPVGYFNKWGYSMSQFFELVQHYYGGSTQAPTNTAAAGSTSNAGSPIATVQYNGSIVLWGTPGAKPLDRYLPHGSNWKVLGKTQYNGEWWYNLGGDQWIPGKYVSVTGFSSIPSKNVTSSTTSSSNKPATGTQSTENFRGVGRVNYVPGYGIMIWKNPASGALNRYLPTGSRWQVYKKTTMPNGSVWYNLGGDQWIDGQYLVIE